MKKFIVLEGMDGAGKSTVIEKLKTCWSWTDEYCFVKDPGCTELGNKIRSILLDPTISNMSMVSELMLFLASRAQLVEEIIKPALKTQNVISDRFTLSTLVYQDGVKNLGNLKEVVEFGLKDLEPDLVLLFDIDPEVSFKRMSERNPDRMEKKGKDYLTGVRNRYLEYAQQMKNVQIIDASRPVEVVVSDVYQRIMNLTHYS